MTKQPRQRRRSLPPKFIIGAGKFVWTMMWRTMMSSLAPSDSKGSYKRPDSQFRDRISPDPNSPFPAQSGRYSLYIGSSCPWAHRTTLVRLLKGLESDIELVIADADADEGGWVLSDDPHGCRTMAELYQLAQPGYQGRCTVPVLWDCQQNKIVNNESAEIIEILNSAFDQFAEHSELDLYPAELREECDRWNDLIYTTVNNGVYRCGFAQTQEAYDEASSSLFDTLDEIEQVLIQQRYLCGDRLTLADIRFFTTLIRFDTVYYGLFKCNRRRISDYDALWGYVREIYQMPGVAATCDLAALKREYYSSLFPLNPGGIIPSGPNLSDLSRPHCRN